GLSMPAGESNPQSRADAEAVAKRFGIDLEVVSIREVVQSFFATEAKPNRVRVGNVAARVRMMRLFDWSHAHRALVVGTSNKTELLLGYGTWHGDLASSINPIGDLYKAQIRQLADFIGVPQRVIEKPPSADLWKGQTDEKEMGVTYETVDRLLYLMVDCNYSISALQRSGFSESMIRKVYKMIVSSQFKRSLPVIPKLSAKTIGLDFHLSRDWLT
ncbi:MAG: NAD(+) synthase, partial [candidate division Zixibacteria bacterium]|nr:NAD(+) synthase [candidate division Zixibacteria bacterium]